MVWQKRQGKRWKACRTLRQNREPEVSWDCHCSCHPPSLKTTLNGSSDKMPQTEVMLSQRYLVKRPVSERMGDFPSSPKRYCFKISHLKDWGQNKREEAPQQFRQGDRWGSRTYTQCQNIKYNRHKHILDHGLRQEPVSWKPAFSLWFDQANELRNQVRRWPIRTGH